MLAHILGLTLLIISTATYSTSAESPNTPITLTVDEVCTLMGGDGITFSQMYKDGKTPKDITNFIQDRIDAEPAMAFTIPGIMKILSFINHIKIHSPELYTQSNFPSAAGIATQNMCLKQRGNGWARSIPGKTIILFPPEIPFHSSKIEI